MKKSKITLNGVTVEAVQPDGKNEIYLSSSQISELLNVTKGTVTKLASKVAEKFSGEVFPNLETNPLILETHLNNGRTVKVNYYSACCVVEMCSFSKSENAPKLASLLCEVTPISKTKNYDVIIYNNGTINIPISFDSKNETIWISQNEMAELFDTERSNITKHISNVIEENKLFPNSVSEDFSHTEEFVRKEMRTSSDGKRYEISLYNLDIVLAVGYRVKTRKAIQFRRWVSNILKEYLVNGYALNKNRLEENSNTVIQLQSSLIEITTNFLKIENDLNDVKQRIERLAPKERVFVNGQYYDARIYIGSLIARAEKKIAIIDPYFDTNSLAYLTGAGKQIEKVVVKSNKVTVDQNVLLAFQKQYGAIRFIIDGSYHDRFLIIDDKELYMIGTSLHSVGEKTFTVSKIENKGILLDLKLRVGS